RPRAVGAVLIALRLRLAAAVVGDEEQYPAVERLRASSRGERDREAERAAVSLSADRERGERRAAEDGDDAAGCQGRAHETGTSSCRAVRAHTLPRGAADRARAVAY